MELARLLKGLKILLIEDDVLLRESLELLFGLYDVELTSCISAEDGLRELEQRFYDIIITDYRLPGIDGLEFLQAIADTQTNVIKVLMTAHGTAAVFQRALASGVHDYLEKPLTFERVESSLSRLLATRAQA